MILAIFSLCSAVRRITSSCAASRVSSLSVAPRFLTNRAFPFGLPPLASLPLFPCSFLAAASLSLSPSLSLPLSRVITAVTKFHGGVPKVLLAFDPRYGRKDSTSCWKRLGAERTERRTDVVEPVRNTIRTRWVCIELCNGDWFRRGEQYFCFSILTIFYFD